MLRVPTYKSKIDEISDKDLDTYGFLGYPVLQAADIMLYKGNIVPVGKDQLPHLELTREIVRRFNHFFGDVFPEPDDYLTQFPVLPGTDGRKMSKSYKNTLDISDSAEDMEKKILKMITDPNRMRLTDPGDPDKCPVYSLHTIYTEEGRRSEINAACRNAEIGCVACKKELAARINDSLSQFRAKRSELESNLDYVESVLNQGAQKAREIATQTLDNVKTAIGLK